MLSELIDLTSQFNAANGVRIDLSEWENATIQVVSPTGAINVTGSNDANAQTGVTDGNALSAINFTAIQVTPLATGTPATSFNASGLYKISTQGIGVPCKYVQLAGTGVTVGKLIIFATKPY